MAQVIPFGILVVVAFSLIWGLLALVCLAYRKIRGGEARGVRLKGAALVLTIALVGWTFIDDRPLPTYMNSVTSAGVVFRGILVVEDDCVFIDLNEPGGDLALLYFPSLTTTGFDPATGTIRFAFGERAASGDAVFFVGGGTSPLGWVTRRHDVACEARADGFRIVEGLVKVVPSE